MEATRAKRLFIDAVKADITSLVNGHDAIRGFLDEPGGLPIVPFLNHTFNAAYNSSIEYITNSIVS